MVRRMSWKADLGGMTLAVLLSLHWTAPATLSPCDSSGVFASRDTLIFCQIAAVCWSQQRSLRYAQVRTKPGNQCQMISSVPPGTYHVWARTIRQDGITRNCTDSEFDVEAR